MFFIKSTQNTAISITHLEIFSNTRKDRLEQIVWNEDKDIYKWSEYRYELNHKNSMNYKKVFIQILCSFFIFHFSFFIRISGGIIGNCEWQPETAPITNY